MRLIGITGAGVFARSHSFKLTAASIFGCDLSPSADAGKEHFAPCRQAAAVPQRGAEPPGALSFSEPREGGGCVAQSSWEDLRPL